MDSKFPVLGPGEIFGVWKVLFEHEERFFIATAINPYESCSHSRGFS